MLYKLYTLVLRFWQPAHTWLCTISIKLLFVSCVVHFCADLAVHSHFQSTNSSDKHRKVHDIRMYSIFLNVHVNKKISISNCRQSVGGHYYLSYVDGNMLLGRAVGGGVFVFSRSQPLAWQWSASTFLLQQCLTWRDIRRESAHVE